MAVPDVYETLVSSDDPAFGEFYGIYAEALSPREQKPRSVIAKMVGESRYQFLLVKRNNRVIGFSTIFAAPADTFCLLEYMAVDAPYRDAGLGAALFRESVRMIASHRGEMTVLLEVDADRGVDGDAAMVRRRQQFYRRLGCRRISGLHYRLPLAGVGPPPEMDLMLYVDGPVRPIRRTEMIRWLTVIYESVYGCSRDDHRLMQMAVALTDPVTLD